MEESDAFLLKWTVEWLIFHEAKLLGNYIFNNTFFHFFSYYYYYKYRVVGKYDEKNSELKCFSVRIATEKEISNTGRNVTQTNSYIKKNFV